MCNRLNQWDLILLGSTISIKTKEGTVITTDDISNDNEITLQNDGTISESQSKFCDRLNQWYLKPLGTNPTERTETNELIYTTKSRPELE